MLIISDRAANVNRMMRIIRRIDQTGDRKSKSCRWRTRPPPRSCASCPRSTQTRRRGRRRADRQGRRRRAHQQRADQRRGSQRLRLRTIITHLDTPLEAAATRRCDTCVTRTPKRSPPRCASRSRASPRLPAAGAARRQRAGPAAAAERHRPQHPHLGRTRHQRARHHRAAQDHALADGDHRQLDIRRAQVLVEAIIVEMSGDKSSELGVNSVARHGRAATICRPAASTRRSAARHRHAASSRGCRPDGGHVVPAGSRSASARSTRTARAWLRYRALHGDGNTNILSTPSVVTLDNEEAEIKVAQEVPFLTGQFTRPTRPAAA